MASEAGPGEGPAPQARSEHLVGLASGPLVGESLGPAGERSPQSCRAGPEAQAPAGGKESGEAPVCGEVAFQATEIRGKKDEAEVGKDVVVENILEVAVIVVEEEREEKLAERRKQNRQARPERGPTSTRPSLEQLLALQLDLEPVNAEASRAFFRLKRTLWQRRKKHMDNRKAVIQGIPGFWVKAILNHPQISAMITDQDEDMLNNMTNLEVENTQAKNHCKITFFFRRNPYFQNEVIIKEYDINITGYRASHSTPVQWFRDYGRQASRRRHHNDNLNFFNWFSDHNFAVYNRIAKIINEDLWPNPLQYYPREEGTSTENGEDGALGAFKMEMIEHQSLCQISQGIKSYFRNMKWWQGASPGQERNKELGN
ncbi:testis-specific Y-encoded protein 2-like [Dasypus novemcinctus]|uniref:testis-specific Y-encoded protein 2-like n=1 Tax=Dasypus novemcinctus TaxID=9361 RepID=UPI0039C9F556